MQRKLILVAALVAGWCAVCVAQAQEQTPQTGTSASADVHTAPAPAIAGGYLVPEGQESEAEDSNWSTLRPITPAIIGGYGSSLAFGEEMERSNYIRGGLTLQSTYDDNPFGSSSLPNSSSSNYAVSIFPQISLVQSRSRIRWLLNYAGGFTYNQQLSQQNQTSQNFNFDLQYRLSPHVSVRATEAVTLTTGLFGPVNSLDGALPGVPQGSNSFVLTPLAKQFSTVTRGEIVYQFTATDVVGATGGFNSLRYRDVPLGSSLLDTQAENASGYYMHRLTPANWIGASYVFQHFGYPGSLDDTIGHSAIAFDTYELKRGMTLSVFGGPQYSENRFPLNSIPPQAATQNMWSVAGGASFGWQAQQTSAGVSYARRIADGGGLQSSVQLNSVSGSLRRQLTRQWEVNFSGGYATNDALTSTPGSSSVKYATGGVGVTRRFGENCFVQAGYLRQNQTTTGLGISAVDTNRNSVIASFSYQFARPWGQ